MARPIYERMMGRVEPVPEAGCWLYTGSVDGGGYGTVSTSRGKSPAKAHRVSYEHHHGPIPKGIEVCHRCDTPRCVNPQHLFLGTRQENMLDCSRKGRISPKSISNLRPGHRGYKGAGPQKEHASGTRSQ